MTEYRIAPKKPLIIESKVDIPNARWCFYMATDSPNEAKRIVAVLNGKAQPLLFELDAAHARARSET